MLKKTLLALLALTVLYASPTRAVVTAPPFKSGQGQNRDAQGVFLLNPAGVFQDIVGAISNAATATGTKGANTPTMLTVQQGNTGVVLPKKTSTQAEQIFTQPITDNTPFQTMALNIESFATGGSPYAQWSSDQTCTTGFGTGTANNMPAQQGNTNGQGYYQAGVYIYQIPGPGCVKVGQSGTVTSGSLIFTPVFSLGFYPYRSALVSGTNPPNTGFGTPIFIECAAQSTTNFPYTSTTGNGNYVGCTPSGSIFNKPYGAAALDWKYPAASGGIANTTTAVTIAPASSGKQAFVTKLCVDHDALGGTTEVALRDGAGGAVIWRGKLQVTAIEGRCEPMPSPIAGTSGNLLEFVTLSAVSGGVYVNAGGYYQ